MPTYLYECKNCGRFEEFQKITDEPIKECPQCGAKVKKIIGAPGIIFKGSGFYSTDNKHSSTTTVNNGNGDNNINKDKDKKTVKKPEQKEKTKGKEKAS
ncbi:MAG: FmdB family transcriptional regulator [Halanaerobiales bacterium]|nr:FmdB family transcriptional regulator [Halanaerobiales bacterium]